MGQGLSCKPSQEQGLFAAVQLGDLETVKAVFERDPILIHHSTVYDRNSALHIAAAHGQIQVLSFLLEQSMQPDLLNRNKQTPLMLAAMHGKISCVTKLIEAGAYILMFDSVNGRTCLHHAAYHGHSDCVEVILSAARSSQVAASWGYSRFVNVRDHKGATPLHLAARQRRPECVHVLLQNGALVCASTCGYGFPGSSPLHLAARSGSLDCIRELLAWGADRLQRDASGKIPYVVALRKQHGGCAALLNPSSAEPLVWPSYLKFMSELTGEAKALLECALMEANREKESASDCAADSLSEASDMEVCGICFEEACTIQVQECGHTMCAHCTLALCCHNKPNLNQATLSPCAPVCPFCRSSIVKLVAIASRDGNLRKPRKSRRSSGGSSSFKGIGRLGRSSGRIAPQDEWLDKPLSLDD
ncbi:putative E3 ubiquitin-protein ligase XBAT31 isoform X1 [Salvia hispanica]|uniref:putative E3 ubiquitin-protein ligase XBAT31 isoform X1 n=1 Tax=Salvia hispanica TaxID=49212 RepID=UPI002009B2C5|nr:putative E3 ubiquitin-protein ligase XBAT31 isoform X1 [Salvia hispanica]